MRKFERQVYPLLYVSLAANLVLGSVLAYYFFQRYYHRKKMELRMLSTFASPDRDYVVFLGDSQIEGFDWKAYYRQDNIINQGISGEQCKDILKRVPDIAKLQPHKVFLLCGINDLRYGQPADSVILATEQIVKGFDTMSTRTELYLLSLLPLHPQSNLLLEADDKKIKKVNLGLQRLAKKWHITYIDLFSKLAVEQVLPSAYTYDGLHLNQQAYQTVAQALKDFVVNNELLRR